MGLLLLSLLVILSYILIRRGRQRKQRLLLQEQGRADGQVESGAVAPVDSADMQDKEDAGVSVCMSECLTCSLIQMGSSLAYGDNTCPHCGASTTKVFLG